MSRPRKRDFEHYQRHVVQGRGIEELATSSGQQPDSVRRAIDRVRRWQEFGEEAATPDSNGETARQDTASLPPAAAEDVAADFGRGQPDLAAVGQPESAIAAAGHGPSLTPRQRKLAAVTQLALERLEHGWLEAMGAWYRSQGPEETFKAATAEKSGQRAEHIKKTRVGDLRFLELARRLVREMVALQSTGSVAEEELDVTTLTLDERRAEIHRLLAGSGTAPASGPDAGTTDRDSGPRLSTVNAAS